MNSAPYVANPVFSGLAPGTYSVSVSNGTCVSASSTSATINAVPVLDLTLTATPNPVDAGSLVTINVTGSAPFSVTSWQPASQFANQTTTSQTFVATASTTYIVTGKSADDCLDTARVDVVARGHTIGCDSILWVPNTFTPNHDGHNDLFRAYGRCVEITDMTIRDQWGNKLHEMKGPDPTWDGTSRGEKQPTGVYVYLIHAKTRYGNELLSRGVVNLIR